MCGTLYNMQFNLDHTTQMSNFLKAAKKCNPSFTLQTCSEEIPPTVLEEQQKHRDQLNERKRDLQERERRDAECVEQRVKARGGYKTPIL